MDKIIVYVNDADHALRQLAPMQGEHRMQPTHWVLVACAPRLTHRVGKWLTHSAREHWRNQWCDQLFAQLAPALTSSGDQVTRMLATLPLPQLTEQLKTQHGQARVLDARKPRFGQDLEPVSHNQPVQHTAGWSFSGAVAGMGVVLVLAAE